VSEKMDLLDTKNIEAFRQNVGKSIVAIFNSCYYFNELPYGDDSGSVEIQFTDDSSLTLSLASDGESVCARCEKLSLLESFDLDENSHCEWKLIELTSSVDYARFSNTVFVAAEAIIDALKQLPTEEFVSGWLLRFGTGDFIVYYNCGDESRLLLNQYPPVEPSLNTRREIIVGEG
jgi:hypothetical protein